MEGEEDNEADDSMNFMINKDHAMAAEVDDDSRCHFDDTNPDKEVLKKTNKE